MRPFISFILILVFVAATFCLPLAAMAVDPLVFGLTLGLTGKYEKASAIQEQGYQLWVRDVNQRGGILGRPVQLKLFDDQSDPQVAIGHYRQFAEQDRVDFLLAPFSSDITEAILPIARQHGYSIIAAGAAADRLWQQGYTNVFGLFTPASRIPASFLEMAVMHDLQTMAVVYCDDPFGRDIGTGTVKWSRRFGLTTVLEQKVGKNSLVTQARNGTIEVVWPQSLKTAEPVFE